MRGGWKPAGYPFILGHEFSGDIVEMGSKVNEIYPEFRVGDRICEWSVLSSRNHSDLRSR